MIEESENIVKKTCRELGITQKELAERIGMKPASLNVLLSKGSISKQVEKALEMQLEIFYLQKQLAELNTLKNSLNNFLSQH